MAVSSSGKLDAICARLKSHQSLAHSCNNREVGISQDESQGTGLTLKFGHGRHASTEDGVTRVQQLFPTTGTDINTNCEEIKVQTYKSCKMSELGLKDESINKGGDNNNIKEATDYNEINQSNLYAKVYIAEAATAEESIVSFSTAECPSKTEQRHIGELKYVHLQALQSDSKPLSSGKSQGNLSEDSHSSLAVLSYSSTPSPTVTSAQPQGQESKKSNHMQGHVTSNTAPKIDNKDNDSSDETMKSSVLDIEDKLNESVLNSSSKTLINASNDTHKTSAALQGVSSNNTSSFPPTLSSAEASLFGDKSQISTNSITRCENGEIQAGLYSEENNSFHYPQQNSIKSKSGVLCGQVAGFTSSNKRLDSWCFGNKSSDCNMSAITKIQIDSESPSEFTPFKTDGHLHSHHKNEIVTEQKMSAPQKETGRKKSRKAAKPQKQIMQSVYTNLISTDHELDTDNVDPMSFVEQNNSLGNSKLHVKLESRTLNHSPPFSLVYGNLDDQSSRSSPCKDPGGVSFTDHSPFEVMDLKNSASPEAANEKQCVDDNTEKWTFCSKLKSCHLEKSSNKKPIDVVHTDSTGLVDFAHNTMKELLGIYGFEGSETKTADINNPQNFMPVIDIEHSAKKDKGCDLKVESQVITKKQEGPLPEFPVTDDQEIHCRVKSGALRRNAHTSMALVGRRNLDNSDDKDMGNLRTKECIMSPSDTQLSAPDLTAVKHAASKKSYTQKVLSSNDFNKYIKRYGNGIDCGGKLCQDLGYRDHYHCLDCPHKVFIRKEEMVRHYKWHKKRQDSLQHGFMRYSPMDDCSKKYGNCTHNGRQTHYHCVQRGCDKVYISTSDVQMHANFHRKDSAIIQEGFQRFRATEDCGTTSCSFYGQRTTHFHCRRPQCNFTFKNKADMEKHKSYHQKDEVLSKDGFKKFMKYESCPYSGCRYSKISNHIHCIRPGCQYVLHSTAQLYSHKRKHERREFEHAYRSFRQLQQISSSRSHNQRDGGASEGDMKKTSSLTKFLSSSASKTAVTLMPSGIGPIQIKKPLSPIPVSSQETIPAQGYSGTTIMERSKIVPSVASFKPVMQASPSYSAGNQPVAGDSDSVESGRQTMALPVRLGNYFSICQGDSLKELKSEVEEPEDLSMGMRKQEETDARENTMAKVDSFNAERDHINSLDSPETLKEASIDGDDIDDDDDDDDDDTDYGKVEEPTLVNTFGNGLEGDKLSDSLNLPIPATKGRNPSPEIFKKKNEKEIAQQADTEKNSYDASQGCMKDQNNSLNQQQLEEQHTLPQALLSPSGKVLAVNIPVRLLPERRERDETWKKYLIRYTANDACFSRCACLYKDHYHCRLEGCQVIFKSKDGVRGHARFHELQDSITPLVYSMFAANASCNSSECQYSCREEHYHCNWTKCSHTIPASAPTFARLEHYRIHEYATSVGKNRNSFPATGSKVELDPLQKRRGRPPKYPKYDLPIVPKVHLTEKEILDSTLAFLHNKCNENSKIVNGFKKFLAEEHCPDEQCPFKGKDHYHCGRKFCHMSTDRLDILNLHAKDFHNNVTILEGFEFFERMVDCRRPVCHNNRVNRHFHCMRPRCDYSFVRHSTMAQHNKKHPTVTSTVLSAPLTRSITTSTVTQNKTVVPNFIPIAPAVTLPKTASDPTSSVILGAATTDYINKTVKSSGTFYPLSGLPKRQSFSATSVSSPQMLSSVGLTSNATHVISGTSLFHNRGDIPIFSNEGVCLTLPHKIVTTTIPMLAHNYKKEQKGVLAGIIPVEHLHQQSLSSSNMTGSQVIAPSQSPFLKKSEGIFGSGVVQVLHTTSGLKSSISSEMAPVNTSASSVTSALGGCQPVTLLLQHHHLQRGGDSVSLSWASLRNRMHYSVELNCGRPFCKLKKKDHYHCLDCNQAFSDPTRLRTHIGKHGFKFRKSENEIGIVSDCSAESTVSVNPVDLSVSSVHGDDGISETESVDDEGLSSSLNLEPSVFTNMVKTSHTADGKYLPCIASNENEDNMKEKMDGGLVLREPSENNNVVDSTCTDMVIAHNISDSKQEECLNFTVDDSLDDSAESSLNTSSSSLTLCSSFSRKSSRKRTSTKNDDFISSDSLVIPKAPKSRKRQRSTKADGDLPEGYKRVCCGEDCGYGRCAYRQTVTHFHCLRSDCGYGFSDRSRIMQHSIRHERLDTLMGGEFQQFRASVSCERADCEFDEKASHFHCLKCPYSCADSSKVPAHRKYHTKLDNISSNGFIKYTGTADCQVAACSYFRKQTHYHCTFPGCSHAVLGPSQMAPHKLKHAQHQSI